MAQQNDTRAGTFLVEADITHQHLRVALSANGVSPAGASGNTIGTATRIASVGEYVAVEYLSKEGSKIYVSSGAIAAGNYVTPAADGKVSGSGSPPATPSDLIGIAVTATAGADEELEVVMGHVA